MIVGAGTGARLRRGFGMPLTWTASGGMASPALVPKLPVYEGEPLALPDHAQQRPDRQRAPNLEP